MKSLAILGVKNKPAHSFAVSGSIDPNTRQVSDVLEDNSISSFEAHSVGRGDVSCSVAADCYDSSVGVQGFDHQGAEDILRA